MRRVPGTTGTGTRLHVTQRIRDPDLLETTQPEQAGIAVAASLPFWTRVVTAHRQPVIDAEGQSGADDLGLTHRDQGRLNRYLAALDARFSCQIRHLFERLDVFGPAIRVAGIVEGIDADEDVRRAENLRVGERICQEDGVPRRHVGDRDVVADFRTILRNVNVVRQRRVSEGAEIDFDDLVLAYAR